MKTKNEISTMFPPPEDDIVHHSMHKELEEIDLLTLSDLTEFSGSSLMPEKQLEKDFEKEERVVSEEVEAAEVPVPFHTMTTLSIEGIEATQATQFYKSHRHLHSTHAEPDNSVPLIAQKHLAIRVYPDLNFSSGAFNGSNMVYGGVWFKRIDIQDNYRRAIPINGSVTGRRAMSINRGTSNHTLNFRISDLYTQGRLVVYARAWTYSFGKRVYSSWYGQILTFTRVPHIRVRAHGIHYQRGNINKPAPVLSDFIATGVYLRKTYPMSRFNFLSYDVINFGGDLTDTTGGGCGAGWNALWGELRSRYFSSNRDANHYGLMKYDAANPIPTAFGGCGGGNVGASFSGNSRSGSIMAQELGHALTRKHAPGCGAGNPDPNYPHYKHPSSATIGEYGMDYATGAVYDPNNSNDFMSYCPNPWTSPYTYRGLMRDINNQPTPASNSNISAFSGHLNHKEDQLYLSFRVSCDGVVDLLSGFTQLGSPGISMGTETSHSIEVKNKEGEVLWAKQLTLEEAHQDHNHSHTNYFEAIPMVNGKARELVFKCGHHDGPTVIPIPEQAPTVKIKSPKFKKEILSGKLKLEWTCSSSKGDKITSIIRYSNNGGETWKPVVIGLEKMEYEVDLDQLPSGKDCLLQVLVSNILKSATAETSSFIVEKKRRVAMISPIPGNNSDEEAQYYIELAGCAYSPDSCAEEENLQWYSSLEGYIGTGSHLIANNLKAGEHMISLVAPDGLGGESRTTHNVRIFPEVEMI